MKVCTASRFGGGVAMIDRSRRPAMAMLSVRGIGVAVRVSRCTLARSAFSASFWRTPKRCSSSTITRPRSLNFTSGCSRRWVPTITSSVPSATLSQLGLDLLGALEARQHLDPQRPVGEAVAEVAVVLFGQQRGRHQHRDLLAGAGGGEGGAHGDFGLAEADVAADHAVHRLGWTAGRASPPRWHGAGRVFPRTGSRRRTARTSRGPGAARVRRAPAGAAWISSSSAATSRTFSAALRLALVQARRPANAAARFRPRRRSSG